MKKSNFIDVDKALDVLFSQKCSQGQLVSGPLLCDALLFKEGLKGDASFKASCGWLRNIKLRYGIREIEVQGEKLSASSVNAEKFISEFKKMTGSQNYNEGFIYNADESALNWHFLPMQKLASANEKSAVGAEVSKEIIRMVL